MCIVTMDSPTWTVSVKSNLEQMRGYSLNFLPCSIISPVNWASSKTRSTGRPIEGGLCDPCRAAILFFIFHQCGSFVSLLCAFLMRIVNYQAARPMSASVTHYSFGGAMDERCGKGKSFFSCSALLSDQFSALITHFSVDTARQSVV